MAIKHPKTVKAASKSQNTRKSAHPRTKVTVKLKATVPGSNYGKIITAAVPMVGQFDYVPGQVIVQFKRAPLRRSFGSAASLMEAISMNVQLPENTETALAYLRENYGLRSVEPLFAPVGMMSSLGVSKTGKRAHRAAIMASVDDQQEDWTQGFAVLSFRDGKNDEKVLKKLQLDDSIKMVERMPMRWLTASAPSPDPMANRQWGLRAIDWFTANRVSAKSIAVAVLDTGIDQMHPDLQGVIKAYQHYDANPDDIIGHGTHVAGTIAAGINNGIGISGVANCELYIWKIFPDKKFGGEYYINGTAYLKALGEVINSGAKILNLSISGNAQSNTELLLFKQLSNADVLVLAAMGNTFEYGNAISYPAAYDNVYAVAAIEETGKRASFSNTGRHAFIAAPGTNILSTLPTTVSSDRIETNYATLSGTSMATPHVAGVAALIRAKYPSITAKETAQRLASGATLAVGMTVGKRSDEFGFGILNAAKAL